MPSGVAGALSTMTGPYPDLRPPCKHFVIASEQRAAVRRATLVWPDAPTSPVITPRTVARLPTSIFANACAEPPLLPILCQR